MIAPFASLVRPPARHPHGGGLSFCRPSGRPASTKHTSATAARRSPVPYARRPRSRLGSPSRLRRSGGRRRLALASPGFTHARGTGETQLLPPPRQPAAARVARDSLCLPPFAAVPNQAGLLQTNIAAISIGVNRLPSSFALLGRGFTMPAVCANACHRPSIHRGSRLGFYRSSVAAISSSHRLTAARFRSLPGETRLTKGFCPFPPPIRQ